MISTSTRVVMALSAAMLSAQAHALDTKDADTLGLKVGMSKAEVLAVFEDFKKGKASCSDIREETYNDNGKTSLLKIACDEPRKPDPNRKVIPGVPTIISPDKPESIALAYFTFEDEKTYQVSVVRNLPRFDDWARLSPNPIKQSIIAKYGAPTLDQTYGHGVTMTWVDTNKDGVFDAASEAKKVKSHCMGPDFGNDRSTGNNQACGLLMNNAIQHNGQYVESVATTIYDGDRRAKDDVYYDAFMKKKKEEERKATDSRSQDAIKM